MKRIIYILTGIVLLSLSSCSDFLEPKSQSEYVPKDANALQEMLIGSAYPRQDKGNFLLPFLSFLDDDIQFHKTDYEFSINSLKDVEAKQAVYTWQPDMFFIMERNGYPLQNIWEGYYNYILGANAALDYIGDVNGTEAEKNYVIAQSLGLRAFYYFRFSTVWHNHLRNKHLTEHLRNNSNELATVRFSAFCGAMLSNNSFLMQR